MAATRSWRGQDGPLHVGRGKWETPLFSAFVEAGRQAGYETTEDYNGEKQEGFGPMEQTVWRGRRWSAASAYLKPALRRDNCRLVRGLAHRVVITEGRARGVEIARRGQVETIRANREVILAASSINSPKLLMLSGIGPAKHLAEHGIAPLADRAGVGANLQDHLEVYVQFASKLPDHAVLSIPWNLLRLRRGSGHHVARQGRQAPECARTILEDEHGAFIRFAAGKFPYPDLAFHFLPIAVRLRRTGRGR